MSDSVLSRSKAIAYFEVDSSLAKEVEELYRPETLPLCMYHFHYPALYFPVIFQHFRVYFPEKASHSNVRFRHKGKQIPLDLPVGLFISHYSQIQVFYSELPCPQAFKLMMISWKRGYTIVNKEGGCDHVFKKLNLESQMELFHLHQSGRSQGLNKTGKYEGNCIAIKMLVEGVVIERKEEKLSQTLQEYLDGVLGSEVMGRVKVLTHDIQVELRMTLKDLLEEWHYNDGYCYLKIVT